MNSNIVRAWKDEFYRQSLSDEERAQLPENPVGELELTDTELGSVFAAGGHDEIHTRNYPCQGFSFNMGGCYTHNQECIHPHVSYDYNDCRRSYRYDTCYHLNSYSRDWDHCHTYRDRR